MMKILILACFIAQTSAFMHDFSKIIPDNKVSSKLPKQTSFLAKSDAVNDLVEAEKTHFEESNVSLKAFSKKLGVGLSSAAVISAFPFHAAFASSDDIEYADLPPPYIPVAFGLVLLVSVGLLTGSLGDVLDEEASLGLQSGARAKKEIERSRSSYFKKK